MKLAAAHAIAGTIPDDQLKEEYVVPSVFNELVVASVAEAVQTAAVVAGLSRRPVLDAPVLRVPMHDTDGAAPAGPR